MFEAFFADFHQFHFLRPEWLLAIVPLLIVWLGLRQLNRAQSGWTSVLPEHLLQHLVNNKGTGTVQPPFYLLAIVWLISAIALAGPSWKRLPQPVYQLAAGKVVVMDMSLSMFATDVKPNRLTRARYKAIDLVNAIDEGEIGLVAYAGEAFIISPLTADSQNITALIPSLSPQIMPEPGSDPLDAISLATELLRNAGHLEGEIFLITDGMDVSQANEINEWLRGTRYRLSVMAVGNEAGAPIKLPDGQLLKDSKGAIVVPRVELTSLKSAARTGQFIKMRSDEQDIEYLLSGMSVSKETEDQPEQQQDNFGDKWQEAGPYLVLLLLPFVAYAFRRGLVLVVFAALLLPPQQAHADWWQDLWKTKDQRANQAFQQQAFNQAADQFEDPQWKASSSYKAGDFEAALDGFKQDNSATGLYNQGNALAQLQQLEAAIDAYKKALKLQPDFPDAQANLELLEKLKEQQDQQQQQNQQQQDQQKQDQNQQQQQDQNQQSQDQQQDQQNQDQQQQQQDQQQSDQQQQEQQEQQQQEANPEQQEQETEEQAEQQDSEQQEAEEKEAEQQQAEPKELTQEELEQQQKLEQWLRKVPDDPSLLLKNKMRLEYQQRRMNRLPGNRKPPGTIKKW